MFMALNSKLLKLGGIYSLSHPMGEDGVRVSCLILIANWNKLTVGGVACRRIDKQEDRLPAKIRSHLAAPPLHFLVGVVDISSVRGP